MREALQLDVKAMQRKVEQAEQKTLKVKQELDDFKAAKEREMDNLISELNQQTRLLSVNITDQ